MTMKSFLAARLSGQATECADCTGGAVRSAGQESVQGQPAQAEQEPAKEPVTQAEDEDKETAVIKGPLGYVITEAINKAFSKPKLAVGVESIAVQANGQIQEGGSEVLNLHRIKRVVGVVPATGEEPTVVNTMLAAARQVDQVEFMFVENTTHNGSDAQPGSDLKLISLDPEEERRHEEARLASPEVSAPPVVAPQGYEVAVESMQVVVNYRLVKKP